jgi:Uma2 family endonuclease
MMETQELAWLAPDRIRPLLRAEYDRLVDAGVFEGERLELLRGSLVTMSPQGEEHCSSIEALTQLLVLALAGRAVIRCQLPLAISDDSEPEPDFAIVPLGRIKGTGHPKTAHLVIEVSASSLPRDRVFKSALYAEHGVPEYWLVDVTGRRVLVHRDPAPSGYRSIEELRAGDELRMLAFPDVSISVGDILG